MSLRYRVLCAWVCGLASLCVSGFDSICVFVFFVFMCCVFLCRRMIVCDCDFVDFGVRLSML